jgi:hypothetical protein
MNEYEISESTPGVVPWPKTINETGMFGIAGEFVRLVSPHTEADPNAILLTFLTFAGNALGRNFYVMAGSDQHCGNLFLCLVGNTGHGRKGSAISAVETFFRQGPRPPQLGHVLKGISSGEGVVWEVHDEIYRVMLNKKTGNYENTLIEPNEPEKRLLIVLSEFQQCLANMRRPESILASILRQAWDKGELSTPAKNSRAVATDALVSVTAAMSRDELLSETQAADAENGMLNRFNFACSRRSKLLPQGGQFFQLFQSEDWRELQERFNHNIATPNGPVHMQRDTDAEENWGLNDHADRGMYKNLNQPRTGLWGAITARAPQIVLRIATITAAINGKRQICREHLDAAYEIWRYCDDSSRYIWGDRLDDPTAADIMQALRSVAPSGLSRTQIYKIWSGHKNRADIDRALVWISHSGIGRCEKMDTGGRPLETWYESA